MKFSSREILFDTPKIMGVLNATPDSFYDGGCLYSANKLDCDKALVAAENMVNAGADFIDVGGESTRPGALPVSEAEESARVLPLVEKLTANINAVISVDTSSPVIMREAAALGAGLINDVRALTRDGALQAAVASQLPVCLMHMQGAPQTMQHKPEYNDVVDEVCTYLQKRMHAFVGEGGAAHNLIIDPGFGFGKTDENNIALLKSLARVSALGAPVLVGLSRKSMIGRLLGREVGDRLAGSLFLALESVKNGASIVRVHDVQATADILKLSKIIGEY